MLLATMAGAQNHVPTTQNFFEKLDGYWQGSLTYTDYSSGKPYTMKADVEIKRIGKASKFSFSNIYPNEKNANSVDTIIISADGKYINQTPIKLQRTLANGTTELVTEEMGEDGNDNKKAVIRHTYSIGTNTYRKRKDVKFVDDTKWLNRHEYSYKKAL
ncbi:MAG: hypothetical protein EAZ47_08870 [Bacteroidetes bacterium]|nr:MAG: hypothetical protein EAY72_08765 [Bacteroidota bacterium]TAF92346.1 MAG: hypothetical protein EAZ47_08870 [Bacteroidota bacterium]